MAAQQARRPNHRLPDFGHDTHRLDQHFLDPLTADHLVAAAGPQPDDTVLDIGAGTGAITAGLLAARPRRVIAVETDQRCAPSLVDLGATHPELTVIMSRLRDVDHPTLRETTMIVANPPFSALESLTRLIRKLPNLQAATICVSPRWARSVVAPIGAAEFGRASVAVQSRFDARIIRTIAGERFAPPASKPAAVIQLRRLPEVGQGLDLLADALLTRGGLRVKDLLRSRRFRHQPGAARWWSAQHSPAVRRMQQLRLTELTPQQISTLATAVRPVDPAG